MHGAYQVVCRPILRQVGWIMPKPFAGESRQPSRLASRQYRQRKLASRLTRHPSPALHRVSSTLALLQSALAENKCGPATGTHCDCHQFKAISLCLFPSLSRFSFLSLLLSFSPSLYHPEWLWHCVCLLKGVKKRRHLCWLVKSAVWITNGSLVGKLRQKESKAWRGC